MLTLLVDNYDSYTYNLYDLISRVNGRELVVGADTPLDEVVNIVSVSSTGQVVGARRGQVCEPQILGGPCSDASTQASKQARSSSPSRRKRKEKRPRYADFSKLILVGKLSPRSTQCTPLHRSSISKFQPKLVNIFLFSASNFAFLNREEYTIFCANF